MALMDHVVKLQDEVPHINMLVYGDSGIGKTVLAGSDDSVLFLAPEDNGTLSAIRMGSKADRYPVTKWDDLMQAYKDLYELVEAGEPIPYKWLCIDSVTEMQAMCMRYVLKKALEATPERDPDVPQIQDWQRYYILFEKMVRAFNDLPVNVLYTALARKVEDADGNEFMVPEIQGKDYGIAMKIVSYMTCYGYMMREVASKEVPADPKEPDSEKKKIKVRQRVIFWEDNGAYRGKDRTLALGAKMVLPPRNSLKFIREKIETSGKTPDGPVETPKAPAKKAPVKAPVKVAEPAKGMPENDGAATISDDSSLELSSAEA